MSSGYQGRSAGRASGGEARLVPKERAASRLRRVEPPLRRLLRYRGTLIPTRGLRVPTRGFKNHVGS